VRLIRQKLNRLAEGFIVEIDRQTQKAGIWFPGLSFF